MRGRAIHPMVAVGIGLVALGSVCEDDGDTILGTYQLAIAESRDTCDQESNRFSSRATISSAGDGFAVDFGQEAHLVGDFNDEGLLVAQGDAVVVRNGTEVRGFMRIQLLFRRGNTVEGTGRLTFNGTFPGVPGPCVQEFTISGQRLGDRAPVVG